MTSHLTAKANEDLVPGVSRLILQQFALEDNQAELEAMYEGCEDRREEMKYTQGHLLMAGKIKMLRNGNDIEANAARLLKERKPAYLKEVVINKGVLERMMDGEDQYEVVEGDYEEFYQDVWLAIDKGILWQPEVGKVKAERY